MSNLINQSLGRYHILEQLGEGGMAIVYKAYDTRLERDVAVKVIRTEKLTLESMGKTLKRFEREAKALAKLTHPNIVPITDYGEHEDKPYLVMPHLPGGTLKQLLKGKPMPWENAVRLLIPIARALHYAHQQGIIHRDVKPSNILITQSGEPMLTDFGIAKILLADEETADLTGTGMGVGTPEYMSPEQFQGKGVDARTDIYSLGVVLYEMVTGRKPYQADTPAAVLIKQVTEPLPRPSSFVRELPEAVEKVLLKTLAKDKQDRYKDFAEFGVRLEDLIDRRGTSRQPENKVKPAKLERHAPDTQETYMEEETFATKLQTDTYKESAKSFTSRTHELQPSSEIPAPRWLSILWIALGWVIGGAIMEGPWTIGWTIGGFFTTLVLRREGILSYWRSVLWITIGWGVGGAIGWEIFLKISGAISWTIGGAIGGAIGGFVTALVLRQEGILSYWRSVLWVTIGWAIGWAIGWVIGGAIGEAIALVIGWVIAFAIGGAIGAAVMIWRIRKEREIA